jgi:hypothetical protein
MAVAYSRYNFVTAASLLKPTQSGLRSETATWIQNLFKTSIFKAETTGVVIEICV